MKTKTIDLNSILTASNVVVMLLLASLVFRSDNGSYVNGLTIVLALILSFQSQLALTLERKQRDPFVILLAFIMIVFFSFRIYSLALYSFSTVFTRFRFEAADSNYALIFIIISNFMIYAGLYAVKVHPDPIDVGAWKPKSPGLAMTMLVLSLVYAYTPFKDHATGLFANLMSLIYLVANQGNLILISIAYYVLFRKQLGRIYAGGFFAIIIIEIVLHSLAGSRGTVLSIAEKYLFVALAFGVVVTVRRSYFYIGLIAAPLLLIVLIFEFAAGTSIRQAEDKRFNISRSALTVDEEKLRFQESTLDAELMPVFDRMGFFDFSAEMIADRIYYKSMVNVPAYVKSIIDNVLTPGFDIFNYPRVSYTLKYVYSNQAAPAKSDIDEHYNSDQMGIYGEFYVLAGYGSLLLFPFVSYGIKYYYVNLRAKTPVGYLLKRVTVLTVYFSLINSFGIDWIMAETAGFVVAVALCVEFAFKGRLDDEPQIVSGRRRRIIAPMEEHPSL
jgi:hypothetical protein